MFFIKRKVEQKMHKCNVTCFCALQIKYFGVYYDAKDSEMSGTSDERNGNQKYSGEVVFVGLKG